MEIHPVMTLTPATAPTQHHTLPVPTPAHGPRDTIRPLCRYVGLRGPGLTGLYRPAKAHARSALTSAQSAQ